MRSIAMFRKSPFSRLLFFYVAGILSAGAFSKQYSLSALIVTGIVLLLMSVLFLVLHLRSGYHTGWYSGLAAGTILFITGYLNMNIHEQSGNQFKKTDGTRGLFIIEIAEPPLVKEKTVKAVAGIKYHKVNGLWKTDRQKIMVYLEKDVKSIELVVGDRILTSSTLKGIDVVKNPGEFDYRRYLATQGIYNQMYLKSRSWKSSQQPHPKSIKTLSCHIQKKLIGNYQKIGMDNVYFSLLSALTLGYKNDLEASTKQAFSQAGVMHVMALSGFNVAVIAWVMGFLLFFFDWSIPGKIGKTILIIIVIWLFAFITGLSPSVTRAAVMISFLLIGKLLHRHINTYNILFASAFFLLTISPALISDIGFQLSFAAVLGIIIFQPVFSGMLIFRNRIADKIWQLFTLSCAAQLSTLPLSIYYFHQFPVYFWLTNLYVVPLVSVIICVAGIFLLVSAVNPLMLIVGQVLEILLTILYKSVVFVELLPLSLIENIQISGLQVFLLISFLVSLALFCNTRIKSLLWLSSIIFVIFQLMNTVHRLEQNDQQVFMAGSVKGTTAITIISGNQAVLLSDSLLIPEEPDIQYAFHNFWIQHGVADKIMPGKLNDIQSIVNSMGTVCKFPGMGNNLYFKFAGKRIVILTDNSILNLRTGYPLKTDLVLITGTIRTDMESIKRLLDPEMLILDSSVKNYQAIQWINACEKLGLRYWNVSQQGAFILNN